MRGHEDHSEVPQFRGRRGGGRGARSGGPSGMKDKDETMRAHRNDVGAKLFSLHFLVFRWPVVY